jgi:hypothetical protein
MSAVLQAREAAVKAEQQRMQRLLDEAVRLGEANLQHYLGLRAVVEHALAQLKRGRVREAEQLLGDVLGKL